MDIHSATPRVAKAGRSEHPFLLFFRRRRSEENEVGNTDYLLSSVARVRSVVVGLVGASVHS